MQFRASLMQFQASLMQCHSSVNGVQSLVNEDRNVERQVAKLRELKLNPDNRHRTS
jgi:hypothetical protein